MSFISSKDADEECVIYSKSNSIKIMIYDKAYKVTEEPSESLLSGYQTSLEESIKGSDFIFNCVNLLHYQCHEMNLNYGGSCIYSPD